MMVIIILKSFLIGALNAFRGSGFLKIDEWHDPTLFPEKYQRYDKWLRSKLSPKAWTVLNWFCDKLRFSMKRIIIPGLICLFAWQISHDYILSILPAAAYLAKMFTGTGGDMQVRRDNTCVTKEYSNEVKGMDQIANFFADKSDFIKNINWCQRWGFAFTFQWGIIYSIPFMFTNFLFAIPTLLYPFWVRYTSWRFVEGAFWFTYCLTYYLSLLNM